jgi:hypothetical protein
MGASGSPARQEPRIRIPGFENVPRPLRRARLVSGARKVAAYIVCMEHTVTLESVPDDELLRRLSGLLRHSRRVEADLVAHVGEVDARRLYAREASPSMFAYCTQVLHLSEFEAYLRITAARAARQHPLLLEVLREGSLHLTAIAKLAPHLTPENCETLVRRAAHRTKREIEELIAELAPRPDAPTVVRKLPNRGPGTAPVPPLRHGSDRAASPDTQLGLDRVGSSGLEQTRETSTTGLQSGVSGSAPAESVQPSGTVLNRVATDATADPSPLDGAAQPIPGLTSSNGSVVSAVAGRPRPHHLEPLSPARYKVQFTASAALRDKLERLAALLRPSVPDGDLAVIIEQAVTEKLERLEARRFAKTKAPRKGLSDSDASPCTRHVPAPVRRAVYQRDEGRCRYVDQQGRRCAARDGLEFHHRHPFGLGGDHSVGNISLACKAHNRHLAEVDYGRQAMARHRGGRSGRAHPTSPQPALPIDAPS